MSDTPAYLARTVFLHTRGTTTSILTARFLSFYYSYIFILLDILLVSTHLSQVLIHLLIHEIG